MNNDLPVPPSLLKHLREEDANREKRELEEAQQGTIDPDEAAMRIQKNYSMIKAKKQAERNRDALAVFIGMRPKAANPEAEAMREVRERPLEAHLVTSCETKYSLHHCHNRN